MKHYNPEALEFLGNIDALPNQQDIEDSKLHFHM